MAEMAQNGAIWRHFRAILNGAIKWRHMAPYGDCAIFWRHMVQYGSIPTPLYTCPF